MDRDNGMYYGGSIQYWAEQNPDYKTARVLWGTAPENKWEECDGS